MKKDMVMKKLAAMGVKPGGKHKLGELKAKLAAAQADKSKPGHDIGKASPQPGDRI